MANNITNFVSIVVDVPAVPSIPTSVAQSPLSPSASGASQSIGQQLVAAPGFWALMIILAVGCLAGASYFFWKRPASKGKDHEGIPLQEVIVARRPEETYEEIREDILAKGDVDDRLRSVAPETFAAPTTPKNPAKIANASTVVRNSAHGMKEGLVTEPPAEMAGLVC